MAPVEHACPKHMTYGPCGGVRDDGGCEVDARPCPFVAEAAVRRWGGETADSPSPSGALLGALDGGRAVLTDLTLPPFDAAAVAALTRTLAGTCDALLVGEHQGRPDFPPTLMARLVAEAGGVPWVTLACRDRNRVVLEQELAGLGVVGVDGVLCVTGDARAPGVRPGVTQVFDLDGTRLAALARGHGLLVAVPESPDAVPRERRPLRLVEKQRAGAHVAVLNHVRDAAGVRDFVARARDAGLRIPVVAAVAVYTDERSARVLQAFPGLRMDDVAVERVLADRDVRAAGIAAAVEEAEQLLAVPGVAGVNLSGLASAAGESAAAEVKAEVGMRVRAG